MKRLFVYLFVLLFSVGGLQSCGNDVEDFHEQELARKVSLFNEFLEETQYQQRTTYVVYVGNIHVGTLTRGSASYQIEVVDGRFLNLEGYRLDLYNFIGYNLNKNALYFSF